MIPVGKLGLSGHAEDSRTLKLSDFVSRDFAWPAAYDLCHFARVQFDADPLGNIEVGDCVIAAAAHAQRWADAVAGKATTVDTAAVLAEYANFGYDPARPDETDNGVLALTMFRKWRSEGICGRKIDAFAQVNPWRSDDLAMAGFLLGGIFLCFDLPQSVRGKNTWDVPGPGDEQGSWGPHMVWSYGSGLVNSWGRPILYTDAFRDRYLFDAFAVVDRAQFVAGRAPSGLDYDGLMDAVRTVAG